MLRGAGRIRRQHIKQAFLSIEKEQKHRGQVLTFLPSYSCIHLPCISRMPQALAVHSRCILEGNPATHTCMAPSSVHVSLATPRPSVSSTCTSRRLSADCGRYPSGIIAMVDAFTCGTDEQRKRILHDIQECPATRAYFVHRETCGQLAQAMALTTLPCRANSVLTIAHKLGCRFKPSHFESVTYQLSLREHWSSVPSLVSLARHHCGRTTARLLNWKMRAFIECHRFDQLNYVMMEFTRDNIKPIRRTFHLLLSAHLRNQDLDAAKGAIRMMENAGFPVDASTHALISTIYRSLGLDTQVHARALDSLPSIDSRTATRVLNSIVQHFLDVGDELGAAQYIKYFSLIGVDVSSPFGNNITEVVGAHLSTRHHTDPANIIRITPDAATFTMLIDYLANKRCFSQVHSLLPRLVKAGVRPDSGIVASLIRASILNCRDDLAVSLLSSMLHSNVLARALCDLMGVKSVPQPPIDARDVPLAVHVFNAILRRAMELRGLSGARFIFRVMRARGIMPSPTTIEIFLDCLDRTEHATPRQLIRVLRSMSTSLSGLTLRHLHIILRSILRREKYLFHGSGWNSTASKFSPIREGTSALPQGRILLDSHTFNIDRGANSCRQFTYDSWLRPIVISLSRRRVRGDRATIAMRLRHESMLDPSLDTARDVLRHMVDQGMHPNQYHYAALMDGYAKGGNIRVAEQIMRAAKDAGFKPEVVMYTVLIAGYGRQGKPELAMGAFRRMISAGIAPDVPAIDALAHAYFAVGAYKVARRVLLQLWTQVKPFQHELQGATLKQLATAFRTDRGDRGAQRQSLTKHQQRLLNFKIRGFQREWRQLELLRGPQSLSRRLNGCREWLLDHSCYNLVKHRT